MTTKTDEATVTSAWHKEEVVILDKELAEMAKSQQNMDKIRKEEKALYESALYEKAKPEIKKGMEGIKLALKTMKGYYAMPGKTRSKRRP